MVELRMPTTQKTTIYLPAELHRRLQEHARRTGRAQATVVREALGQYLESTERLLPTSIGVAEDTELAGRDAERWVEGRWQRDLP